MNDDRSDLARAAEAVQRFVGENLGRTLSCIERSLEEKTSATFGDDLPAFHSEPDLIRAALLLKRASAQIDVVVHAVGILLCLPHVLEPGERIQRTSLGAGSSADHHFDLQTDRRVAEFKFSQWRRHRNSARQGEVFQDFCGLAEYETQKRRILYVLSADQVRNFLSESKKNIQSALPRRPDLRELLRARLGESCQTVREYYLQTKGSVEIEDVSKFVPELIEVSNTG